MSEADVQPADDGTTMHIGEVAARTELSLRSLRHWEEVGLVRPSGRTDGGFRLYTDADVDRILAVRRMKPLGFTLEEMAAALRDIETASDPAASVAAVEEARQRLEEVLLEATRRQDRLRVQLAMADEFVAGLSARLGES